MTPEAIIRTWKDHFGEFWPKGNRFYGPLTSLEPGEVAVLNLAMPGKMTLSTGVLVIYADDESFAFMTPEGHQFAAWITFSSYRDDPAPVIQVQALMRASDPLYELSMPIVGHRMEDRFWVATLQALAARFGDRGRDGRHAAGLRRSPAPVALCRQHPPERRDPDDALSADPSAGLVSPQRECLIA